MSASVRPYILISDQHSATESESFPEFDTVLVQMRVWSPDHPLVSVPLEGRFPHFVVKLHWEKGRIVGLMLQHDVLWDSGILLRQTEEEKMSEMYIIIKIIHLKINLSQKTLCKCIICKIIDICMHVWCYILHFKIINILLILYFDYYYECSFCHLNSFRDLHGIFLYFKRKMVHLKPNTIESQTFVG